MTFEEEIERQGFSDGEAIHDLTSIRAAIADLAKLDPLEYEAGHRKSAARRLNLTLATLDRKVEEARGPKAPPAAPAEIVETTEPWPDPVDGVILADELRALLRRHVVFTDEVDADAVVLWVIAAWTLDAFRLFPKLLIASPTKRCGKSTLLELIASVSPRAMATANVSPAALFRAIEKWQPTLIVDEADRFLSLNPELVGIVNAGHLRSSAYVLRCVETPAGQDVVQFSVWAPQVIGGIGSMEDTIEDRSVRVELRRRLPAEHVERMPRDVRDRMCTMRRQLARWSADAVATIEASEAEPPECGNDRRLDNWTPLWRVAMAIGEDWPSRALAAYVRASQHDAEDSEPAGVLLVQDVHAIFEKQSVDYLPTEAVLNGLLAMIERPWLAWSKGKPLTANKLGRLARPFGIGPKVRRKEGGKLAREWSRVEAREAFSRYSPAKTSPKPVTPATALKEMDYSEHQTRNGNPVNEGSVSVFSLEEQACNGVTGFSPGGRAEEKEERQRALRLEAENADTFEEWSRKTREADRIRPGAKLPPDWEDFE